MTPCCGTMNVIRALRRMDDATLKDLADESNERSERPEGRLPADWIKSVTYVSGLFCYLCPRPVNACALLCCRKTSPESFSISPTSQGRATLTSKGIKPQVRTTTIPPATTPAKMTYGVVWPINGFSK